MISYEWSDWRAKTFYWIMSVYVHPDHRRRGIFRQIYAYTEAKARDNDAAGLRLYVEKENEIAKKTYEALGMSESCYNMYEVDWVLGR